MAARKKDNSEALFLTAIQVIEKSTKKKPIQAVFTQMPHAPSGSAVIDHLIGGNVGLDGKPMCPGYPRGKITEIFGEETSGKTTAALQAIAEAQKRGERCMFLDFEKALHFPYAKSLGVDFDKNKLLCYEPDTFEQGLMMLFAGIKAGVGVLVVDSVASMVPASELEKELDKAAQIGILPQKMATNLPKMVNWLNNPPDGSPGTALLLLNQTRAVINTGPGPKGPDKNTSGGKALKFYAALRLLFKKKKSAYIERKDPFSGQVKQSPYGAQTEVRIIKSKVDAKEGRTADIFIRYGEGIDEALTLIESGVIYKFVKYDKPNFTYEGKTSRGKEAFRSALLADPKAMSALREKILARIREQQAASPKDATPEELVMEEAKDADNDEEMANLFDEVKKEVLEEESEGSTDAQPN